MTSSRLSNSLQIASNLGIIAGLVLVAMQIQQTRDLTTLQFQLEATGSFQQMEQVMMGQEPATAWAKSIQAPDELSAAEIKIVDSFLINHVNAWTRTHLMENAGLVPPGATRAAMRANVWFYFGNPFARQWWRTMAEYGDWEPTFRALMDEEIERADSDFNARWLAGTLASN